eukprot:jgi/Bigna1/86012/estExt_fgenesh1_pg.C_70254
MATEQMSYRELQALAKEHGIPANQKKVILVEKLAELEKSNKENKEKSSNTAPVKSNKVEKMNEDKPDIISFKDWNLEEMTKKPKENTHIRFVYDKNGEKIIGEEKVEDEDVEDAKYPVVQDEPAAEDEDDEEINETVERMPDPPAETFEPRSLTDARSRASGCLPPGSISVEGAPGPNHKRLD